MIIGNLLISVGFQYSLVFFFLIIKFNFIFDFGFTKQWIELDTRVDQFITMKVSSLSSRCCVHNSDA